MDNNKQSTSTQRYAIQMITFVLYLEMKWNVNPNVMRCWGLVLKNLEIPVRATKIFVSDSSKMGFAF